MEAEAETPAVEVGPPAIANLQDPLPEASWFWRRFVSILIIAAAEVFNLAAGLFLWLMGNSEAVLSLAKYNLGLAALAALLYLAGANMAEITKLMQHSKLLQKGIIMRSSASATGSDGSTATSTTVAGKPAEPMPDPALAAPPEPAAPAADPAAEALPEYAR